MFSYRRNRRVHSSILPTIHELPAIPEVRRVFNQSVCNKEEILKQTHVVATAVGDYLMGKLTWFAVCELKSANPYWDYDYNYYNPMITPGSAPSSYTMVALIELSSPDAAAEYWFEKQIHAIKRSTKDKQVILILKSLSAILRVGQAELTASAFMSLDKSRKSVKNNKKLLALIDAVKAHVDTSSFTVTNGCFP